jgi:hypothetical protein
MSQPNDLPASPPRRGNLPLSAFNLQSGAFSFAGKAVPVADLLLREGGWQARADTPVIPLGRPLDWAADPLTDRNWVMQLHALRFLFAPIHAYEDTGEDAYLRLVRDWIGDWARWHETAQAEYSWYDMSAGIRAAVLAWVCDRTGDDSLAPLAREHIARLADPAFQHRNNHGIFQAHGLMALAMATGDVTAQANAARFMEALIDQQFLPDGIHAEHSPFYHSFAIDTFERVLGSGWFSDRATGILRTARINEKWMIDPRGRFHNIGDSAPSRRRPPAWAYDTDAGDAHEIDGRTYRTRVFHQGGYAFIRSDWDADPAQASMLAMHAGHHSRVHKHADPLTFNWYDKGRHILVEGGKYGFTGTPERRYFLSTAAHNTVVLDDQSDAIGGPFKTGALRLSSDQEAMLLTGRVLRRPSGMRHSRTIRLVPGRELKLMDRLIGKTGHACRSFLHLAPGLEAELDGPKGYLTRRGRRFARIILSSHAHIEVLSGQKRPLQGWISEAYLEKTRRQTIALADTGDDVTLKATIRLA